MLQKALSALRAGSNLSDTFTFTKVRFAGRSYRVYMAKRGTSG